MSWAPVQQNTDFFGVTVARDNESRSIFDDPGGAISDVWGNAKDAFKGGFNLGKVDIIKTGPSIIDDPKGVLKDAGKTLVTGAAMSGIPGISQGAQIAQGFGLFGGNGSGSILDDIKEWFDDTKFWQRVALVIFALIMFAAAFYLLAGKTEINMAKAVS